MTRRLRSRSVQLTAGFTTLTAAVLATTACTEEPENVPTYCVRPDNSIISNEYCDGYVDDEHDHDATGVIVPYYIIYGNDLPRNLQPGAKLPTGGTKIAHTDHAARAAVGIPKTGGFGSTAARVGGAPAGG